MSKPSLRSLLPLGVEQPSTPPEPSPLLPIKKKRRPCLRAGAACTYCRKRKTACDGARPACSTCSKRSLPCEYLDKEGELPYSRTELLQEVRQLKQQEIVFNNFLTKLKYASKTQTEDILSRLGSAPSPIEVAHLYDIDAVRDQRPSQASVRWIAASGFTSSIDARLTDLHPMIFQPPDDLSIDQSLLSGYLKHNNTGGQREQSFPTKAGPWPVVNSPTSPFAAQTGYTIPVGQLPKLPRFNLDHLQIAIWTSVPVSNEFAIRCITSFLETDHSILGLFDPVDFLESLLKGRYETGLGLLVNSILAFACQIYAREDANILVHSSQFEEEAERLWNEDRASSTFYSIAGLVLMLFSLYSHDNWSKAKRYFEDLCRIVKDQKLFGPAEHLSNRNLNSMSERPRKAVSYLTWGIYNFMNMEALFYITEPPEVLPSIGIGSIQASDLDSTFIAFCRFWVIANKILRVYRGPERMPSLSFALSQFQALLSLADQLPSEMEVTESSTSAVLVFHIWFHIVILDLFRPFVSHSEEQKWPQLFDHENTSPADAICAASIRQLKRLILLYLFHHEENTPTLFWHVALLYLTNFIMKDAKDPDQRSWLLLCIQAYNRFRQSFVFGDKILQGLLGMAVEIGVIDLVDAKAVVERCSCKDLGRLQHDEYCRNRIRRNNLGSTATATATATAIATASTVNNTSASQSSHIFVLDLNNGLHDRVSTRLDVMAQKFQEMKLFDEFTTGIV